MGKDLLAASFGKTLARDISGSAAELLETGLDQFLDEGVLREIPFVSTALSVAKLGMSIRERHCVSKLAVFIQEINKGCVNEEKRKIYIEKFKNESKIRNKELEYVLILIDRYISLEKPKMLAKLYWSYLQCGIDWLAFTKYSEILDRLLPDDLVELNKGNQYNIFYLNASDSLLRLVSYGFVVATSTESVTSTTLGEIRIPPQLNCNYTVTPFGTTFMEIINE